MDESTFTILFDCLKILQKKLLTIPIHGKQKSYEAFKDDDTNEKFNLVINRKGHLNDKYLTYQLTSRHGILIRLDTNGSPHENHEGSLIETPHAHIFNDKYDHGRKAIPLTNLTERELIEDIEASLIFFLEHNNIQIVDITKKLV